MYGLNLIKPHSINLVLQSSTLLHSWWTVKKQNVSSRDTKEMSCTCQNLVPTNIHNGFWQLTNSVIDLGVAFVASRFCKLSKKRSNFFLWVFYSSPWKIVYILWNLCKYVFSKDILKELLTENTLSLMKVTVHPTELFGNDWLTTAFTLNAITFSPEPEPAKSGGQLQPTLSKKGHVQYILGIL